ncbi:MAG TPA: response regulator transcription factor [Chthoniobacteraceae bacterium]|nr:response regulator transcription factor [Chthoniobacteraceae bacterium]
MKILIIEDDPLLLRSLAATFREEGYVVGTAADGEEGLYKAQESGLAAIVLDVMLPRLDGWEVLERLRPGVATPVLMLTARDTIPDRVRGLNEGADDYLTKPFDSDELLARVRALIRRAAGKAHPVVTAGPLVVNTATRRVEVEGREVALTAREYLLLEYLALHQGEVVSRTTLYDHLFGDEETTLSNLLDVHISNLRKKLGGQLITTRRGHGYSLMVRE